MNNPNPQPWDNQYAPNTPPQWHNPNPGQVPPQWQPPCPGQMPPQPPRPWPPAPLSFITEGKEVVFAVITLILSIFLCNCVVYSGFHLGFALCAVGIILASGCYLLAAGHRPGWYSFTLSVLCILIAAGFARSDDGFVKFIMVIFLFTGVNLSLCLTAKQNRRPGGSIGSLLDAPRTQFVLGFGQLGKASRGLGDAMKRSGSAGKQGGAVMLGLVMAFPLVLILIFLLMRSDAAFEGLMDLLPEADWSEPFASVIIGIPAFLIFYTRGVALNRSTKPTPVKQSTGGLNPLTVNTLLAAVCSVYLLYLLSQLAYFWGGFSGILPEEYTLAQYARRGFFEMAWLCAIDLGIIWFAIGLVKKEGKAPTLTRLLCLFIGLVTIFMVCAASAKMLLYIGAYGLTRLRVLTEVIIVFFGLTTATVCLWLFLPKLPYMKAVMILALTLGAVTIWADVDTVVARYNVEAYRSGALETVDVDYLSTLSDGAVPYVALLTEEPDALVAAAAKEALIRFEGSPVEDFRGWNWASAQADEVLKTSE